MEELTQVKKKGNPNFGKKQNEVDDVNKLFKFVLVKSHEKYKPRDKQGGHLSTAPYPPIYQLPSEGITVDDETGRNRRWRCVKGIDTIWVDEQDGIEVNYNDLEELVFVYGKLNVRGYEKNKLAALKAQDIFAGKKYKKVDVKPIYRLVDEEAELSTALDSIDLEFEALKTAKECSEEEMLPFAYVLGINTNQSMKAIRKEFILKAKANASYFLKHFVDPKNEIAYVVHKAVNENIISTSIIEGKLIWVESRKVIMDAPKGSDIAQDIAKMVMQNDAEATKLFEQLKKM